MSKNIFYIYNPETDNFERYFPTLKERLLSKAKYLSVSIILAAVIFVIVFYCFQTPTEKNLKEENSRLKREYGLMNRRVDKAIRLVENINEKDNNFYRVVMQLDPIENKPINLKQSNLKDNEFRKLADKKLISLLNDKLDLLENQLYQQLLSFKELSAAMSENENRLTHIPSIIPINFDNITMSSGYGYRLDPIYGTSKFHEGLDFAASWGTPVYATADGIVALAERKTGYGNCVEIDHGYNYLSRYAHLSEINVKKGTKIQRGQLIGRVGSTGKSTGPHLHYEIRFKDEPQNPINYYFMDLTPEEYELLTVSAENAGNVMD